MFCHLPENMPGKLENCTSNLAGKGAETQTKGQNDFGHINFQ